MQIKIKYHVDIDRIEKIVVGDWIDLRAGKDTFVSTGEMKMIPLGISMELPDGYEAHVVPRSSTFKNYGIVMTNSIGIIDNSYCGDNDIWQFPAYCVEGKDKHKPGTTIHKNERICQFRIVKKQPEFEFFEVETLGNPDRNGFGSTGKV